MTDYSQQYFTIESLEDGNVITLTIPAAITTSDMTSISYSVDGGTNWTTTTIDGTAKTISVSLNRGKTAIWKGTGNSTGHSTSAWCYFTSSTSKQWIVYGNIMSLLKGDSFTTDNTASKGYTFTGLFFSNTTTDNYLITAENLIIPIETLRGYCYYCMFKNNVGLLKAPKLPATTLAERCYMSMFQYCTSLTKSPELKASKLYTQSYAQMFYGCSGLVEVTCLVTDISATNCLQNWVYNVSASGTFYKHPSMTSWTTGSSGIPSGWTTKDYMMLTINGKVPAAVKFVQNGVTHDLSYLKFGNNLVWQKTS